VGQYLEQLIALFFEGYWYGAFKFLAEGVAVCVAFDLQPQLFCA
jgi:hypothetical protein